jgi:hypothetical protein
MDRHMIGPKAHSKEVIAGELMIHMVPKEVAWEEARKQEAYWKYLKNQIVTAEHEASLMEPAKLKMKNDAYNKKKRACRRCCKKNPSNPFPS